MPASPYASTALSNQNQGGVIYCNRALMPSIEGDLFISGSGGPMLGILDPIPIRWGEGISAEVLFEAFQVSSDTISYVVMQTDWGDNNWVDVAWANFSGSVNVNNLFVLSSAGPAVAGSFNQTRLPGTQPAGNSSNAIPLGERVRFVGKSNFTTSGSASSGSSGVLIGLLVTIRYRIQPKR